MAEGLSIVHLYISMLTVYWVKYYVRVLELRELESLRSEPNFLESRRTAAGTLISSPCCACVDFFVLKIFAISQDVVASMGFFRCEIWNTVTLTLDTNP